MKFGLRLQQFKGLGQAAEDPWRYALARAQRAEADGFDSFWLMDHFYNLPVHGGDQHEPFLDAWTALPALAAATSRIRLGPLVTPVGYRNPALLARMATSLDRISNGRLYLGIGAGGYRPEYHAYGFDFPERPAVRIAQMEEALQLMKVLWTQSRATYHGRYFRVTDAILEPKPVQQPYPPILIGGVGEKVLLRALARTGDACNLFGPPAEFRRVRDVLRRHCEAEGRDETTIEKTTFDVVLCARSETELKLKIDRLAFRPEPWKVLVGTPPQLVDLVGQYQFEGAQHLLLEFHGNDDESYELFRRDVMSVFLGS